MRKLKYTALLFVVLFTASSCNKWLDLKPEDGIIRQNYWETKEQLNAAVVGCYSSLQNPDLLKQLFRWGEMRADMVSPSFVGSVDDVNIKDCNILASNTITDWSDVYQTINYCNTVLEFGPGVTAKDNTLTQIQLNAYLGEAHAIRGLMYFYLLRAFGEVPLQLKASASDATLQQLAKSSKEDVSKAIIDDFKFAETNVPLSYSTLLNNKGRITKYAVYAMLADVYLWNNDYENCITYCQKVEDSNQFALLPKANSQQSFFNTIFRNGNSVEGIFELQFDSQKQNPAYGLFAASNRPYIIGDKVPDYFGVDDVDPLNKDYRGDGCSIKADDQSIAKAAGIYSGADFKLVDNSNSTANWIFYRYSDILLMKAEALAWSGRPNSGTDALALVERVRKRANALDFTSEDPLVTSPEDITAYILRERSREFAFEGKRWFDILRVAKRNDAGRDLMLGIIGEAAPADRQQSILSKYRDSRSLYFPISQYELQADHNLVQNPYYQ